MKFLAGRDIYVKLDSIALHDLLQVCFLSSIVLALSYGYGLCTENTLTSIILTYIPLLKTYNTIFLIDHVPVIIRQREQ